MVKCIFLGRVLGIVLTIITIFSFKVTAINFSITGRVTEEGNGEGIPFAIIIVNDDQYYCIADPDGHFNFVFNDTINTVSFRAHAHRSITLSGIVEGPLDIRLAALPINNITETSPTAVDLVTRVLSYKDSNNLYKTGDFYYNVYTKIVVETDSIIALKQLINNFLGATIKKQLKPFDADHNILIVESTAQRFYKTRLKQKELITGIVATGVDQFSASTPISKLQAFNIYDNFINISAGIYKSPVAGNPLKRYNFDVVDMVFSGNDTTFVLRFAPIGNKILDAVQGYIYVSNKNYAVTGVILSPTFNDNFHRRYIQSYSKVGNRWFPLQTLSTFSYDAFLNRDIIIRGRQVNYYTVSANLPTVKSFKYDDIVYDFLPEAGKREVGYWRTKRREPLSLKDRNTYYFYDTLGKLRNVEQLVNLGERLYDGQLSFGKFGIDLGRVLNFNYYENIRIGIGGHTNYLLDDKLKVGGYVGYGLGDAAFKYGADANYLLDKHYNLKGYINASSDYQEPGSTTFSFDKPIYKAEALRRYQITRVDRVIAFTGGATFSPVDYTFVDVSIARKNILPRYTYTWQDINNNSFNTTEFKLGTSYAFGDQYTHLQRDKISLGSRYPKIYIQTTLGQGADANQVFTYTKVDAKINYKVRILGFGTLGLQLVGGVATGSLPYPLLYNGRGSYRETSTVTYNSFETMRFNEFLSNRYASLYISHNFEKFYLPWYPFQPYFTAIQNFGIGNLDNSTDHKGVVFKTLEAGFIESGLLLNNMYVFSFYGLDVGFGLGAFARYGPNALPNVADNLVYKFAINFEL